MRAHKDRAPEPVVTVGIPTRDRPELLREAIESVVRQDFSDWVLLVWDNGDLPANRRVVDGFSDARIRYVAQASRAGIAANFNYILAHAGTRYCTILHDDDLYHPEYLRRMIQAMANCGDAQWGFCDAEWRPLEMASSTVPIVDHAQESNAIRIPPGPGSALRIFAGELVVPCPAAMYRIEVAKDERFDERYLACDLDFFVRLASSRPGAYLPMRLLRYRSGTHTVSKQATQSGQFLIDEVRIGRALLGDAAFHPVRSALVAAHRRRVRKACRAFLMSLSRETDSRGYAPVREVLKGEAGLLAKVTRIIVAHATLVRLMVCSQGILRSARRVARFRVCLRVLRPTPSTQSRQSRTSSR